MKEQKQKKKHCLWDFDEWDMEYNTCQGWERQPKEPKKGRCPYCGGKVTIYY